MKTLVVYDSWYDNTAEIARAIGRGLTGRVGVVKVRAATNFDIRGYDLIIVGSPTHGGLPTPLIQDFLDSLLAPDALSHTRVAAFDTRVGTRWVKLFGFAANRIAEQLEAKGGELAVAPEGFYVSGKAGPLRPGEADRAAQWAQTVAQTINRLEKV